MSALLSVRDLSIAFGSHVAVERLSFDVEAGETVAIVGESGSGKSATALAIMRLIEREGGRIAGGSILLDADAPSDLAKASDAEMRRVRGNRIAMVFQEPMTSLNPVMRVGDQVAEAIMRHRGYSRSFALKEAEQAFERVRIPEPRRRLDQFPHELSGGLRQRVMIAMALACQPQLLIADEPTTALDVTTQAEILQLIRSLQAETGMAVLFITHDMGVVGEIADRIVVMRKGALVEKASVGRFFSRPVADYSKSLLAATPRLGAGGPQAPAEGETVLRVEGLTTGFSTGGFASKASRRTIVDGVSLSVGRGETLGLVGESGCGKSTLARSILRLVEPERGTVEIGGRDWTALSGDRLMKARRDAQMVFQDPYASLNPRMAVREAVTEPARIHGLVSARDVRDFAVSLVERVGLEADCVDRFPHQFSGGQRQRLAIARALSVRPKLIIADEAVSALDVSIARQVTDLMLDLQQREGLSFLFISHDIAVVERVSHRIAVMHAGRIVETGRTSDVLGAPQNDYTRRLLSAVPRLPAIAAREQVSPRCAAKPSALPELVPLSA
jgi:peptide/nickel transport system ATP-binding protein